MSDALEEKLRAFWSAKRYTNNVEDLLQALGKLQIPDLSDLFQFPPQQLEQDLPEFHRQLRTFIKQLPIDATFLKAIGVDHDISELFRNKGYNTVGQLVDAFVISNIKELQDTFEIEPPASTSIWAFIARHKVKGKTAYFDICPTIELMVT